MGLKWFKRVEEVLARQAQAAADPGPLPRFDFDSLLTRKWFARLQYVVVFRLLLRPVFAFLRTFVPVLKIGRLVVVSRHADVIEVLRNARGEFPVVYGPEMTALGGADGVLGLDGPEHDALRAALESVMQPDDLSRITAWARDVAEALIEAGNGEIDVARDLITRTATEVCCRYFGIATSDPDALAEWSMAMSIQLFADPQGGDNAFEQARIGAVLFGSLVDDAIERARANHAIFLRDDPAQARIDERLSECPVIERLLFKAKLPKATVRAAVVGMATGFVPTNTLAAGNMLEELRRRPQLYEDARIAARAIATARAAGDVVAERDAMTRLTDALFVAGRFNPALSPGIWRHSPKGGEILGSRSGPVRVAPGSILMVSVFSALRDRRAPQGTPREAASLIFGAGPHSCMGARIAMAQIAEVFAALLAQPGLRPAKGKWGRMWRAGPFPVRFDMRYDRPCASRALLVSAIPLRPDVSIVSARKAISDLGNPVEGPMREALDATGVIQFASINVIETEPGATTGIVLVELNGDGSDQSLSRTFAEAAAPWLAPVFEMCTDRDAPEPDGEAIAAIIGHHVLALHRKPWGATGLHFDGLGELSVADIARQDRVAREARELIDRRMGDPAVGDMRAVDMLTFVRRVFQGDYYWRQKTYQPYAERIAELAQPENRSVANAVIRPSRRRLHLADWKAPKSIYDPIWPMLRARDSRGALLLFGIAWLALGYHIYRWALGSERSVLASLWSLLVNLVETGTFAVTVAPPPLGDALFALTAGFFGGFLAALLVFAAFIGVIAWRLRALEKSDKSDDRIVSLADLEAIAAREDAPGYEQNHIIALMPLKPGLTRKLTFAFSFWWIKQAVTFWFRPGFVATMGTIHKARWFRVPGTRQFVFHSNYDGSWESYLEDFITRVAEGQTSAWSHGIGFPPTRFLVFDGARDGDRFKRWVRRQQRPSHCWYSRFPTLTAMQIRRNALIEDGLARAASDTDARRWLANFGSAQREVDELESQEVQAIVFNGFGSHRHATALMLNLPPDPANRRRWLKGLLKGDRDWPELARVAFGDLPFTDTTATLGLTGSGLRKFGVERGRGFDQFPGSFAMGMGGRAKLLGDLNPSGSADPPRWTDRTGQEDDPASIDATLIVYGPRADQLEGAMSPKSEHDALVARHVAHLVALGGSVIHATPCSPPTGATGDAGVEREHFGFRDGISQPVIRGSRRSAFPVPERDLVAPGEFILGYRNNQGFVSPAIGIGAEHDPRAYLPTTAECEGNRFPFFGNRSSNPDLRDFGRNGTFLVLRELDQDVDGFQRELERQRDILNGVAPPPDGMGHYPKLVDMIGHPATTEWIAAKIIGRWQDGTPLVGNSARPSNLVGSDRPDNDFAYGVDDPRGYACPLGAHIRRTNPRDSLEPGDPEEQGITNRHRILRRGRTYTYTPPGESGERKGLLFAALCSDIERQFEFVQHTWTNASSFHGLSEEADPLLGNPQSRAGFFTGKAAETASAALRGAPNTRFTIPTASGPVVLRGLGSYVTYRGGGYFFVPSRSALHYLVDGIG